MPAFNEYKVVLYGEQGNSTIGAYIHCYQNGQNLMSCIFYNDESNVPANSQGERVALRYPMSKFSSVLDILRNEQPLYFYFSDSSKVGYIATNQEPVGDGEQG